MDNIPTTTHPYRSRRLQSPSTDEQRQHCRERPVRSSLRRLWTDVVSSTPTLQQHQLGFGNGETNSRQPRKRRRRGARQKAEKVIATAAKLLKSPTVCQKCGARKFEYESVGFCCADGEVRVATNEFPNELVELYTGTDDECKHFQKFSRFYNNFFAFSSLGGSFDCQTVRGIYVFKLHGQIYHFLPNLIPHDQIPKYLQLYFYDSQTQYDMRSNVFDNLQPVVIARLMKVMDCNPYAKFFKKVGEQGIDAETVLHINKNAALDQRVFNAPTADEVAVIWSDRSASASTSGPYIVVSGKIDENHRIQHYYGCYDALQYPLLFPYGDSGWHPGIPKLPKSNALGRTVNPPTIATAPVLHAHDVHDLLASEETLSARQPKKGKREISCREYYAYMLQIRKGNRVLASGRLLLQFIVDMYVKLENTRLDYLRINQSKIRADLYQGLMDSVIMGQLEGESAGHRVVLPPSFIGGPRDMKRRYYNAMALVQKFGKPDVFATMTCNPNWSEIKAELGKEEIVQNRPDLISRIFRAKLMDAKKEMITDKLFGEVAAFVYVIEFQKRGLPHAHFLIILKPSFKIKSPEDYDKFVSAEIPSVDTPHLRAVVLNHMMHGPCGSGNRSCPCMKNENGQLMCKARYPKQYSEYTTTKDDGYPIYKRRNTGETVCIRGQRLDNTWVIPYNPYLVAMFDCHFNVEVCSTIQAVKYIYKYIYKGHDRISFNVGDTNSEPIVDEIQNYQSGRWVSPPEAAWRIFAFDLFEMVPPVMPLNVHCDKKQNMHYGATENLEVVLNDQRRVQTPLTEFFRINSEDLNREKLLYVEFPQHYTWDDRDRTWRLRKQGLMIGRLAFVAPTDETRFYLRMLLANVRGPTSFVDLRTVDSHICNTYQEACIKLGLIDQNNTAQLCLEEAAQMHMPYTLRSLFVSLLIFCRPPNPKELWQQFYKSLSEDIRHDHPNSEDTVFVKTAVIIEQLLDNMGRDLSEFGLDHLKNLQDAELHAIHDIEDALNTPIPEEYVFARTQLNIQQQQAFDAVMHHVRNAIPGVFFIDGPGGTGKTYLYGALFAEIRLMHKIVLPTASSGIAASCLPSGRTAHSRFKLPIDHDISLSCNVPKQGGLAALIREAAVIIWDEAPMANKASIHALDLLLQDICSCTTIFGGKIVIFGGDFRQVLPVVPHKSQHEAVEASLVCSYLWPYFKRYYLTENMRAREDPEFAKFLLRLGDGRLQNTEVGYVMLPNYIKTVAFERDDFIAPLLQFFDTTENDQSSSRYTDRAILTARNDDVDVLNKAFIDRFAGNTVIYKSLDSLIDQNCTLYPTEFLNTLAPGGMTPHELILKINCPVMLLRNIDPPNGLCNGTRLICKKFFPNTILCEIATGYYKTREVFIHMVILQPAASSRFPFEFQRKQFPIKLCFAMTINKAQGQTLNEVGIYLQQPCFSHGQLYVALSRARSSSKVTVFIPSTDAATSSMSVRNIVSYEVLKKVGIIQE